MLLNANKLHMNLPNIFKLIFNSESFADAEIKESKRKIEEEDAVYGNLDEWRNETLIRVEKNVKECFFHS
jgi:hypothetical protein